MKTRIITIELGGEELCRHLGILNLEIPADVTDEELEELNPSFFNGFKDKPKWELEESEGIWGDDQMEVVVISEEPTPEIATAKLVRSDDGKLVLRN